MAIDTAANAQAEAWELLYRRVTDIMRRFGTEDSHKPGDYWVHDSYWGFPQVKIFINNLALLKPQIVDLLQQLLVEFAGWEIMVAVSVRGEAEAWPDMGLTIRAHEIVDGLQRQYFPEEYRGIKYEGSRRGTDRD
jgi:hypothetical protein